MAGPGPDLKNAALGAAFGGFVGPFIDEVIKVLKYVFHCREECKALREYLEDLKPLMDEVSKRKDVATTNWLNGFVELLEEADGLVKTCKSDSSEIKDRSKEIFYGKQILGLKERIQVKVSLSPIVLLAHSSASTSNSQEEVLQQVPCKILGMEDHFSRVKLSIIEGHASEISSCVGIQGMGGGGKTLLAKMVNNDKKIQDLFGSASILWITVGRDASIPAIYDQMRNRLDVRCVGGSLEDQQTHLMNEFLRRRVLLILDDVWDNVHEYKEVVEWLNIAKGLGSVTLITTRNQSITRSFVNARMEVILRLSEEQSWELFCTHAFGTDRLPSNKAYLERLAKDVCKECKCLPLALKVVGLAMKGKCDVAEWRTTLNRLQNSSMINKSVDEQLFERLRMSYDELDESTKVCFIYFAAFPEDCEIPVEHLCGRWVAEALFGEDLEEKEAMDEACCVLNELRRRCLIENCVSVKECVKMHDILRDLAIHMSSEGKECARESLFMMNKKDLTEFPASWLRLPLKVKRMSIWGNKMKRFSSDFVAPFLKICMLYPESWRAGFGYGPSDSQECTIEDDFFKHLDALRYLQLCCNHDLQRLPESIGGLGSLQHLNLSGCAALKELPESIGGLGSLQHLNLMECNALKELPESIGGLGSLQHLDLSECNALKELPESIGGLGCLQHLDLWGCKALKELPESIGGLGSLQDLYLLECNALKELPESIGGLGSLQHLNFEGCGALKELPESMGGLGSLQHLDLSECAALKELPESIGGLGCLQHLDLCGCKVLKELPKSIGGLGSLQHLNLWRCCALKELPKSIGGLGSLQHLNVSGCCALKQVPKSIGSLVSLRHLNLKDCNALKELPESIGGLGSLQHLNVSGCAALKELPEKIGGLRSLQHLNVSGCCALKQVPKSIGSLVSLRHLNLKDCSAFELYLEFLEVPKLQIIF